MKIFRTSSGALYIIHTLMTYDGFGYPTIDGYRVVRFVPDEVLPRMDERVDNWMIEDGRLVLIKDHAPYWYGTTVILDVDTQTVSV